MALREGGETGRKGVVGGVREGEGSLRTKKLSLLAVTFVTWGGAEAKLVGASRVT